MNYFIIRTITNGDQFMEKLNVTNDRDATIEMCDTWHALSRYDQDRTENFFLIKTDLDEDGNFDFENGIFIDAIK